MKARHVVAALLLSATAFAQSSYVRIPPGAMGDHKFTEPFLMSRTEVTVREFSAFVRATGYSTVAEKALAPRTWKTPGFSIAPRQPVVYVTFQDAAAYCKWDGGRVPTDPEWEYAARAGTSTVHYWGDAIDGRYLWYRENSQDRPQPVARKRPNAWGLHDMEGNVSEWTEETPNSGVLTARRRGGSWVDCEYIDGGPVKPRSLLLGLGIYFSVPVETNLRYDNIGFRCVRAAR